MGREHRLRKPPAPGHWCMKSSAVGVPPIGPVLPPDTSSPAVEDSSDSRLRPRSDPRTVSEKQRDIMIVSRLRSETRHVVTVLSVKIIE